ncbi:hypothetical protein V1477_001912 [Vespula maculifrons]|uniref:Uncharacterized protein n=1 Tax=Vespula maculifrons TaxID=7453 RepID=A0ABD2CXI9_VESMC
MCHFDKLRQSLCKDCQVLRDFKGFRKVNQRELLFLKLIIINDILIKRFEALSTATEDSQYFYASTVAEENFISNLTVTQRLEQ